MLRRGVALLLALAGCPKHPLEDPQPVPIQATPAQIPLSIQRDLDILFLVDNSNSMGEEQGLLAQQFPKLMFALSRLEGGFPNAHIGVISSDLGAGQFSIPTCQTPGGDRGCLQVLPGCGLQEGATFINITNDDGVLSGNIPDVTAPAEDASGNPCCPGDAVCPQAIGASDGAIDVCDIAEAFSCIATLGVNGCGFEHHWEAVKRALDTTEADGDPVDPNTAENGCNGGFQRDGALLAVVLIADEDDCSASNGQIFTPDTSQFGPLQSFRCFEFGMTCDQPIQRNGGLTMTGCRPLEGDDSEPSPWFYPPSRYISFFQNVKPAGKLVVAVIGGPWDPDSDPPALGPSVVVTEFDNQNNPTLASTCAASKQKAAPGIRLRAGVDALDLDGIYASDPPLNAAICSPDFSPALDELQERIRGRLTPGCIPSPLTDANGALIRSWTDAQCTIEDVQNLGSANQERKVLPRCEFAEDAPLFAEYEGRCPTDAEGHPLAPGAVQEAPCWFFCDSSGLGDAACDFDWQLRVCRDAGCNPTTSAPPNTVAIATCTTCNAHVPGCLCGDGVCDPDLDEDELSCCQDCREGGCPEESAE